MEYSDEKLDKLFTEFKRKDEAGLVWEGQRNVWSGSYWIAEEDGKEYNTWGYKLSENDTRPFIEYKRGDVLVTIFTVHNNILISGNLIIGNVFE